MIPIALCKSLGIPVTNQPGSNARSVAELVLGLSLAVLRRMVELDRRLRRGEHLPNIDWLAETLDDKVVGLVGMGAIAREAAKKFYVSSRRSCPVPSALTPSSLRLNTGSLRLAHPRLLAHLRPTQMDLRGPIRPPSHPPHPSQLPQRAPLNRRRRLPPLSSHRGDSKHDQHTSTQVDEEDGGTHQHC